MYRTFDMVNGLPPRIYRSPNEVRRDMDEICAKIKETNLRLNLRALVIDLISSEDCDEPGTLIAEIESAAEDAREALTELRNLEIELTALEYEMGELKWLTGR